MKTSKRNVLHQTAVLFALASIVLLPHNPLASAEELDQTMRVIWPDLIPIPMGMEPEGIEMGRGTDFFVGAYSYSGNTTHAGAIYRGDLESGEGEMIVSPTGKPLSGLSYDERSDFLYTGTGFFPGGFAGPFLGQGVNVYAATSGRLLDEIVFGDGMVINDVLVTETAVYCTDSISTTLYKLPLEDNGKVFSSTVETIEMQGFELAEGFNANGLVGDFSGKHLVIINTTTGVLYRVDTETGAAAVIDVQGAEQLFQNGDGLYLDGRTLYVMQNFTQKIAVVQLSEDLTQGTFVKNLVSDDFSVPTTITGYGGCIYTINTRYLEFTAEGADPNRVQSEVVKVFKE